MTEGFTKKFQWFLGVMTVWAAAWLLLGARAAVIIREQPHPFLRDVKLTGAMLVAITNWAFTALAVMLAIGLIQGLLTLLFLVEKDGIRISFKKGLTIGLGNLLWSHGLLYLMVPAALDSLPGLKHIPMAMVLLLFFGSGAAFITWSLQSSTASYHRLRVLGILVVTSTIFFLPHDLFRQLTPGPAPLPRSDRRLAVVSIDALRKDVFESIMPEWKTPGGATAICALPATRLTWNVLLGAPLDEMQYSTIMPSESELKKQGDLPLLRSAEKFGIRTAFIIDDSLTPSFGLQPNLFTTVLEPEGGWKYWFTLGFGSCWPIYSWAQNYLSQVETSNIWCDTKAYYRDIDRMLETHAWVSSHNCELHAPITPRFEELRTLSGWKWLWRSAYSYKAYGSLDELNQDKGQRIGLRADPTRHFRVRSQFLLERLRPFLARWQEQYPNLSGVVTSDHGEYFATVLDHAGVPVTHFSGIHGFALDPDTLLIPMHPFGQSLPNLGPEDAYSWLDLRDNISSWIENKSVLTLRGGGQGHLIQIPNILAAHLSLPQPSHPAAKSLPDNAVSNQLNQVPSTTVAVGLHPKDILGETYFLPSGLWFCNERSPETKAAMPLSSAIVRGKKIITFNPENDGNYARLEFEGYKPVRSSHVTKTSMQDDLAQFRLEKQPPLPKVGPQ